MLESIINMLSRIEKQPRISRREFLKVAALGVASIGASQVVPGCISSVPEPFSDKPMYTGVAQNPFNSHLGRQEYFNDLRSMIHRSWFGEVSGPEMRETIRPLRDYLSHVLDKPIVAVDHVFWYGEEVGGRQVRDRSATNVGSFTWVRADDDFFWGYVGLSSKDVDINVLVEELFHSRRRRIGESSFTSLAAEEGLADAFAFVFALEEIDSFASLALDKMEKFNTIVGEIQNEVYLGGIKNALLTTERKDGKVLKKYQGGILLHAALFGLDEGDLGNIVRKSMDLGADEMVQYVEDVLSNSGLVLKQAVEKGIARMEESLSKAQEQVGGSDLAFMYRDLYWGMMNYDFSDAHLKEFERVSGIIWNSESPGIQQAREGVTKYVLENTVYYLKMRRLEIEHIREAAGVVSLEESPKYVQSTARFLNDFFTTSWTQVADRHKEIISDYKMGETAYTSMLFQVFRSGMEQLFEYMQRHDALNMLKPAKPRILDCIEEDGILPEFDKLKEYASLIR